MKHFYRLDHYHNNYGYDQRLHIGTFSSIENVEAAIKILILQQGFKEFPREAFKITKVEVDKIEDYENGSR